MFVAIGRTGQGSGVVDGGRASGQPNVTGATGWRWQPSHAIEPVQNKPPCERRICRKVMRATAAFRECGTDVERATQRCGRANWTHHIEAKPMRPRRLRSAALRSPRAHIALS